MLHVSKISFDKKELKKIIIYWNINATDTNCDYNLQFTKYIKIIKQVCYKAWD